MFYAVMDTLHFRKTVNFLADYYKKKENKAVIWGKTK